MTSFTFLISDMTVWCDCSQETKRHLPIGWKAMANLKIILQSWELIEKDLNGQSWFSGVMYGGVSRNTRTDCQNIDDLQQEGWRKHGENGVQTNKVWRKWFHIILRRTDAAHEEPIYQPFEAKRKITGKKLMLGKIECRRRRERQRVRWLKSIVDSKDMALNKTLGDLNGRWVLGSCCTWSHKSLTSLSDWTTSKN